MVLWFFNIRVFKKPENRFYGFMVFRGLYLYSHKNKKPKNRPTEKKMKTSRAPPAAPGRGIDPQTARRPWVLGKGHFRKQLPGK